MDPWLFLVSICLQKIQENLLCWISHHVLQIYNLNTWQMMQSGKATAIDFQPKKILRWTSFLWSLKTMTMAFCHCCLMHKPFSGHRGFVHSSILDTNDSFISFKADNEDTLSVILKYMLQARCEKWNLILKKFNSERKYVNMSVEGPRERLLQALVPWKILCGYWESWNWSCFSFFTLGFQNAQS